MATNELFIEPDEYEVGRLGSSQMGTGSINSQHCILTNKRLYHKGVSFASGAGGLQNGENIINVEEITCSGYYIVRHVLFMILGVFFIAIMGIVGIVNETMGLALVGLLIGGLFILIYFVKQQRVFKVFFGGGMLAFEVRGCNEQSLKDFNRQIQQAAGFAKHN